VFNQKEQLGRSVMFLLRPLVRLLLRSGIGCSTFGEWAKHVYVEVAEHDFVLADRPQSTSRIAVLTGLHRKEVAAIRKSQTESPGAVALPTSNRAERVVQEWLRDPDYLTPGGEPRVIPIEGEKGSFNYLASVASGDIYPTTILYELERVGGVERRGDSEVALKTQGYVPTNEPAELIKMMGQAARDLLRTLDNNLDPDVEERRLQLSVAYDNLPPEILKEFRVLSHKETEKMLMKLNKWLAQHDRDTSDTESTDSDRMRAGVGVYYFEEEFQGDDP
jgi:hypothetical protein